MAEETEWNILIGFTQSLNPLHEVDHNLRYHYALDALRPHDHSSEIFPVEHTTAALDRHSSSSTDLWEDPHPLPPGLRDDRCERRDFFCREAMDQGTRSEY